MLGFDSASATAGSLRPHLMLSSASSSTDSTLDASKEFMLHKALCLSGGCGDKGESRWSHRRSQMRCTRRCCAGRWPYRSALVHLSKGTAHTFLSICLSESDRLAVQRNGSKSNAQQTRY